MGVTAQNQLIWIANGQLLTYLLLAPRWRWRSYLAAGFAGQLLGAEILDHRHLILNLLLATLNLAEVAIGAALVRRRTTQLPRFTDPLFLVRYFAYAVLGAPAITGAAYALISAFWLHRPLGLEFEQWVVADALGAAVTTPAWVAVFQTHLRSGVDWKKHWINPAIFAILTAVVFAQSHALMVFILYPALILVLLRFGLGRAAMAALTVAAIGSWFTLRGYGPFVMGNSLGHAGPALMLQLYIASGVFMLYAVSTVLGNLQATQRRLEEIVGLHKLVTENSRDIILLADYAGIPRYISPAVYTVTGWKPEETMERGFAEVAHPEDLPRIEALMQSMRAGASEGSIEYRIRRRNGGWAWVEVNMRNLQETGVGTGLVLVVRDITRRKRVEHARDFHLSLIAAIHEVSLDGVLVVNTEGKVVSYNKRFSEVWRVEAPAIPSSMLARDFDLTDEYLLSQCVDRTKDPEGFLRRVRELYAHAEESDQSFVELKDGRTLERYSSSLRDNAGNPLGRVWFFRDITERKNAETELRNAYQALEALAVTDPLTHLANRRRLDQCLTNEWRRGLREHTPLSLLLLDVDLFKSYNDTYGHLRGDSCLKQVAEAAQDVIGRPGDLVARFGGEEFAIVLPNTPNEGAVELGEQICASVRRRRLPHSSNPLGYLTISAGCATVVPALGQHAAALIQKADDALYAAKRNGRNQVWNANASVIFDTAQAS